ncbi:MAG TPA: SRPBCC domain-containing protein [Candidatus Eisenbacteria bacterium]|jgi:uncharacterized protein YndB with AHSA1/START domain
MAGERGISDDAVRKGTGKRWSGWMRILDRWGARSKGHAATARHLAERYGIDPWWSQSVTVRYEQERGLRRVHERASGKYEISVSRVIGAPARRVFDCFIKPSDLSCWFTRGAAVNARVGGRYRNRDGDRGVFLAVRPPRLLRFTWENPRHAPDTVVEVAISSKGPRKVSAALTHGKLKSRRDAAKMKEAWSWAMDSLRSYVETGEPIDVADWERDRKAGSRARHRAG